MVMVNLPTAGVDYHVPFGGRKGSAMDREQESYAREFYTTVKTSYVAPDAGPRHTNHDHPSYSGIWPVAPTPFTETGAVMMTACAG